MINYNIELSNLNFDVQIIIDNPPCIGIEPIMTGGNIEGGEYKGKIISSPTPTPLKWTGLYKKFKSPGYRQLFLNVKGQGLAKVICKYCQNQYSYSYTISEHRKFEQSYPVGKSYGLWETPKFPWDGAHHSVPVIEVATWERSTKEIIEKWKKELETEIWKTVPPYQKCPYCHRYQPFMVPDLNRKIISVISFLMMIPGIIIVITNQILLE